MANHRIKTFLFILFCFIGNDSSALAQARVVTLPDCYKLALERSSTIAISLDQINQTDAQIKQARSGYMPVLSLQGSTTQQADSTNPLAKSLSSTSQSTSNINLSQNLFQGFRDINIVNQRSHLKIGFEWARKQALQQLYKDVAQAFYSLLIFQSDIALYNEQITSTRQRKSELSEAKKSGRARDSDILTAESSIASLEAAISRTRAQLVTYQESFTFLTGLTQDVKLANTTKLPNEFKNVAGWLENSEHRPDIQQSKNVLLAAEAGIKAAQSGFYPSLGFTANYYLSRPNGIFQGVDWDAGLVLSFPFFSGGLTRAQVSEATVVHHSKELNLRLTKELASQTIRTIVGTVQADFDQLEKLINASDLSRRSYELVHRDNRLGVATNTDVLMALQVWQESKRNLERTRITAIYDYVKLLVESSKVNLEGQDNLNQTLGEEK